MTAALLLALAIASPVLADDTGPWNVMTRTEDGKVSLIKGIGSKQLCEDTACMAKYGQTCAAHDKAERDASDRRDKVVADGLKHLGCLRTKPKDLKWVPIDVCSSVLVEYKETPHHWWCPVEGNGGTSSCGFTVSTSDIRSAECFE